MIITGDIAAPGLKHSIQLSVIFNEFRSIFQGKSLLCNLEGLLGEQISVTRKPVLSNHPSVISVLKNRGSVIAALANNHILDLPEYFDTSVELLKQTGIFYTGAGKTQKDAELPVNIIEDKKHFFILNACWDFLLYNHDNPTKGIHVAEINEASLLDRVLSLRKGNPNAVIIVYLHWSFDLETLPFPMHRIFSRALIDNGANIVAGNHSHCVQGGEKYNNGFIVYGLGNFFIPYKTFAGSYLTFPDFARLQLAFEFNVETNTGTCHWFEYQNEGECHTMKHLASERFEESVILKRFSPYSGMSDSEYYHYFRKNRRKKFLIPIFKDYRNRRLNKILTLWLKIRARFARMLATYKIIGWQR